MMIPFAFSLLTASVTANLALQPSLLGIKPTSLTVLPAPPSMNDPLLPIWYVFGSAVIVITQAPLMILCSQFDTWKKENWQKLVGFGLITFAVEVCFFLLIATPVCDDNPWPAIGIMLTLIIIYLICAVKQIKGKEETGQ